MFLIDGHKKESKVMEGAGKTPVWNEEFQFPCTHPENAVAIINAYDKDNFSVDHLGEQRVQVKELMAANPTRKNI